MKRSIFLGILVLGIAWSGIVHAQTAERIQRFDEAVAVNPDASFAVTETIVYDFGTAARHGIYRDIPVQYAADVGNKNIVLSDIHVTDQSGAAYPFSITHSGTNERIRMGDANLLISGIHTYVISYKVARAISYFSQYDELYWNVTGNGWQVPIDEASVTVRIPGGQVIQSACYEGSFGSTEPCSKNRSSEADQMPQFTTARPMGPGEGLTVSVGFPKGVVSKPSVGQDAFDFVSDNLVFLIPIIVFFVMLGRWYMKGRDPRGSGTIIAEYEAPDALLPLEIAAIMGEGSIPKSAVPAEIIYLATQGYIQITRTEKKVLLLTEVDYTLTRLKKDDGTLPVFETIILDALFAKGDIVQLSDLRNTFYKALTHAQEEATRSVVTKGYFPANPMSVRATYTTASALIWVLAFVCAKVGSITGAISCVISGLIVVSFGHIMPKVSQKGAVARERIKGLKVYMEVAEQARIEFHNAPEKNPQLFESLLPYAMVLGVEKEWALQFKDLYTTPPTWYAGPYGSQFNTVIFADSLAKFRAEAGTILASTPSGSGSGGGGFSGGGFGGGGGGSW